MDLDFLCFSFCASLKRHILHVSEIFKRLLAIVLLCSVEKILSKLPCFSSWFDEIHLFLPEFAGKTNITNYLWLDLKQNFHVCRSCSYIYLLQHVFLFFSFSFSHFYATFSIHLFASVICVTISTVLNKKILMKVKKFRLRDRCRSTVLWRGPIW